MEKRDWKNVTEKRVTYLRRQLVVAEPRQKYATAPERFRFFRQESKEFNHSVIVNIFNINEKPIFQVINGFKTYQLARWLPNVSSEAIWRALRIWGIEVCIGSLDAVTHDVWKRFVTGLFQADAELLHIATKLISVSCLNSMKILEKYQGFRDKILTW